MLNDLHLPLCLCYLTPLSAELPLVISVLKSRLTQAGFSEIGFSGHSFRKGAAQHASNQGMLDSQIQKLGRWTSNSFQLYFETSSETLFNLNLRFQTGRTASSDPSSSGKISRKTCTYFQLILLSQSATYLLILYSHDINTLILYSYFYFGHFLSYGQVGEPPYSPGHSTHRGPAY